MSIVSTLFARSSYEAPCKNCKDRTPNEEQPDAPNCHMTCKKYIAYSEERRLMSERKIKEHELERTIKKSRHTKNDIAWNALNKKID